MNQIVEVNGKTHRLAESCIPSSDPRFDGLRAALRERGIVDHVNARPPRSRNRFVQLFLMADGSAVPANSGVLGEACRRARELSAKPTAEQLDFSVDAMELAPRTASSPKKFSEGQEVWISVATGFSRDRQPVRIVQADATIVIYTHKDGTPGRAPAAIFEQLAR